MNSDHLEPHPPPAKHGVSYTVAQVRRPRPDLEATETVFILHPHTKHRMKLSLWPGAFQGIRAQNTGSQLLLQLAGLQKAGTCRWVGRYTRDSFMATEATETVSFWIQKHSRAVAPNTCRMAKTGSQC